MQNSKDSKINKIIAIDPGKQTGYVEYDGKNWMVETLDFWQVVDRVSFQPMHEVLVIVEVPTNKAIYHNNGQNVKAMGRTGVNVGSVIRESELLAERFSGLGYTVMTVAPTGKASASYVKELTGYEGRTNQHVRDAIMMAYKQRLFLGVKTKGRC